MVRGGSATAGPTLAVVAREAGVSVPTASKVVNGREDVAPETRRRVTEALDRLGYVRRPRFEASKPPRMVDLVVHSLESSWSGAVLHGVEQAAHDAGLEVVVSAGLTRTRGARPERGWFDKLTTRGSAGVLFNLAELSPAQYSWLAQHRIPFVLIDPVLEPPPGVVSVGAANWQGGLTATEHLLGLGHERIAVIAGYRRKMCSSARVAGYRSALTAAGIPYRPEYVRYGNFMETTAHRRMLQLLDLPEPPTAVFVCSDKMALGVYEALAARGLRVPGDVSVVGFDDLPEARWATPGLTTVRQPLSEMASTALRLLVRMMDGDQPEGTRTELSTRLVERGSTGALRSA
ncbi:LacI family transcriptional regulator [Streptomyces ipomoeae]|uniref:Periplasmic binding protein and sugar binding domain of the LacI family protein n=2 Tax=Streptomyces ipomoeae TaxID=103232 RepID=L1L1X8_9ACTN|nr:LacI family DNA-binding transcriptional regulator [Streptomyces ipomoeae]EKX67086.1 periplasmic binding protein and sugar binding domain of the LacI family protein [Streptomyces ipomoeae 91-03]MDX2695783.1 LacI family DNA-binding transcriptional regulator [Streptomyces ipomoeae]MDX2820491.1 LacI family DNA-binding transcriptional regulator [Streptomyces ipomoeae]MDX2838480.1 LacI family DNA-binding transcriptional regulator [Streptomyces ipomoeae]MDX2875631.1 LacI family DNA-binding transcr